MPTLERCTDSRSPENPNLQVGLVIVIFWQTEGDLGLSSIDTGWARARQCGLLSGLAWYSAIKLEKFPPSCDSILVPGRQGVTELGSGLGLKVEIPLSVWA